MHPDPLVGAFPDLFLDGLRRCRGEQKRVAIAIARARNLDPADHHPMHAACHPMGAGEQQRGSEMRREVSGGPRSECRSPEEGNEVPGDARVLIDQDPEDASLVAQEAQDLSCRQRSTAPEDTHTALLPAPLEEGSDAWVVRLLRNGAARDPERGHEPQRDHPQQGPPEEKPADADLAAQPLAERRGHPCGTGFGSSSGGGQPTFAARSNSQSSRTAPWPASRRETQRTSETTSGAASRGAQERATFRSAGRSLTSSPMYAVCSSGTPRSAAICSIAFPFALLDPTTRSIESSRQRCSTRSARRPVSAASFTPPYRLSRRRPWPSRTSNALKASPSFP